MKRKLVYLFLILTAILAGHYIGKACLNGDPVWAWLGKQLEFGFDPHAINLQVLVLNLGMHFTINALQAILIFIAILIAPKVSDSIN
ncbi:MAG: DUF4321 domain-containing protein [Oscillospiraceae bacterium]|nr:DUF4321 domain-containing protein [Oscillospiraceae bacterium]